MDNRRERADIYVRLISGGDDPPLDAQLARGLQDAAVRDLEVAWVYGTVAGPLTDARRDQLARLFERLRADELEAAVVFATTARTDLELLGQQARTHGFSIAVGPRRITITTPWEDAATDRLPV